MTRWLAAFTALFFTIIGAPAALAGWQDYAGRTLIVTMQGNSASTGLVPFSQNVSMKLHLYFSTEGKLFYSPSDYKYGKTDVPYDGNWGVVFDMKSGKGTITIDNMFGKNRALVKASDGGLNLDIEYGISGQYGDATFRQKLQLQFAGDSCAATSLVQFDAKIVTQYVKGTSKTKEQTQSVKCVVAKGKK